jgi:hypothetical protein
MKKAWIAICPPLAATAKISALPSPSALIAWLPWMKVGARKPVTQHRGAFEIERFGRRVHLLPRALPAPR